MRMVMDRRMLHLQVYLGNSSSGDWSCGDETKMVDCMVCRLSGRDESSLEKC